MTHAAIYSRVDKLDRTVMPAHKAEAEEFCRTRGWTFAHYTDSGSGARPPRHFAGGSQLIRPQLTRLLMAVESGAVGAVIPSSTDALAARPDLEESLNTFLQDHGFERHERSDESGQLPYYLKP